MTAVHQTIEASVEDVFSALCDPRTYPEWLVGAKEIRAVDDGWPVPGSRFHHRVGLVGPLTVADSTTVLDVDRPHRLDLEVRARPFGRARASFSLRQVDAGTEVTLEERPLGALRHLQLLLGPLIAARNAASLRSLADQVARGTLDRPTPSADRPDE